MLGSVLVERHPIAETATVRMRRAGQEATLRRVATGDARVTDAGKNRELLAVLGEFLQVGRQRVVAPGLLGKEELRHDPHVRLDGDQAAGDRTGSRTLSGMCGGGRHRLQPRQRESDANAFEQGATGQTGNDSIGHGRSLRERYDADTSS